MKRSLDKFNISSISRKLNKINAEVSVKNNVAFPCLVLLSNYRFKKRFIKILPNGDIRGSYVRMISSLIDFSNFKARLGADLYNEIFHILVDIFRQLKMITFSIIAHDGTLFPTRARYRGCTWFSDRCSCIEINDVVPRVKKQIMYRLNNLNSVDPGKMFKIKCDCPYVPEDVDIKTPKMEVLSMNLEFNDGKLSQRQINTALLFGVKQELEKHGMCIKSMHSNINTIDPCSGKVCFRCPKIPKDTDAKIGVRRDPRNASKKQKIFGYNLVLSTSVELDLKLELPVAATNIAGNGEEGKKIITNTKQIRSHHNCQTKVDIADAKYDTIENYTFLREKGSIPIIDYNPRREKLTVRDLKKRGYDRNGWPFAPCGIPARPNGFDKKHQRHTFCCFKQCLKLKVAGINNIQKDYDIGSCPHVKKNNGYTKHTYIKKHPRLLIEIPRGTKRFKAIKQCRTASERAFAFIVKISALLIQYKSSKDPAIAKKLKPYNIHKSILSIIQIE